MIYKVNDLNNEEKNIYTDFLKSHERCNFQQSIEWGNVKTSWEKYLAISGDIKNIKGSVMLWVRSVPIFGKLIYISRGPIVDIDNEIILSDILNEVKQFAKEINAFAIMFEPDVLNEKENFKKNLINLGFKIKKGKDLSSSINPTYVFRVNLKNENTDSIIKKFHHKTRYNINYAIKKGIEIEEGNEKSIDDFYKLLEITGIRDEFIIRDKEYYINVWNAFEKENKKIYFAKHNNEILAGIFLIKYGNKVWYLYGASSNNKRNLMPTYLLQWQGIKWAIESQCDIYDLMGTPGITKEDKNHHEYGLFKFKSGYNANLCEFIGQILYINKPIKYKMFMFAEKMMLLYMKIKKCIKK